MQYYDIVTLIWPRNGPPATESLTGSQEIEVVVFSCDESAFTVVLVDTCVWCIWNVGEYEG